MNDQEIYRQSQRELQDAQVSIINARDALAGGNQFTAQQWITRAVTTAKNARAFIDRFGEES